MSIGLNDTLGALLGGGILQAVLYGINLIQTFTFFMSSSRSCDPLSLKLSVLFLTILDTAHLALSSHMLYYYLVSMYGNATALEQPTISLIATLVITILSNFIIRWISAIRLWKISKGNWLLICPVAILNSFFFGMGLYIVVRCFQSRWFTTVIHLRLEVYSIYGAALVADGMIASSFCFFLARHRIGLKSADDVVNILMIYCINTSLVTSLLNIAYLIAYITMPTNFVYLGLYLLSSKLLFSTLLSTLNGRGALREKLQHRGVIKIPLVPAEQNDSEATIV